MSRLKRHESHFDESIYGRQMHESLLRSVTVDLAHCSQPASKTPLIGRSSVS